MARRIKLTRSLVPNVDYTFLGAYRLGITVSEAENVDPRIFLFDRAPVDPYANEAVDTFMGVAGPVDMSYWPAGEPDDARPYAIFRTSSVELDFRAISQAEAVWLLIVKQVNILIEALNSLENLEPSEEVWCGDPPDASASDSASVSTSDSVSASA